jgi:colanic acid biosynthesis glycosyl transferase WcaI
MGNSECGIAPHLLMIKSEFRIPKPPLCISKMRVLLLNQCFYPDHVSTSQHLTDLALGLAEAGHEVTAVASSRGYDNPDHRYATHETWRGIEIHRIWTPGLGKKSKWRRLVDFAVFWLNATFILLRLPRFDVTVCLTSPPLISSLGTLVAAIKGGAVVPWVMDLNPDEAVAAGWLRQGSIPERVMTALQNWSFRRAAKIIALDRFMADRLEKKGVQPGRIHVDAPWSHDDAVRYDESQRGQFRREHGLAGKFVIMYSGNHSPCHPLDTLLGAAEALKDDARLAFLFIGGGAQFPKVKEFAASRGLKNIITLPYQPLEKLSASLSSADLHIVAMGAPFVGIVHPCKVYNIMTLGTPFLYLGPEQSHVTDLIAQFDDMRYGRQVRHGDVEGMICELKNASAAGTLPLSGSVRAIGSHYGQGVLCPRLVEVIHNAVKAERAA